MYKSTKLMLAYNRVLIAVSVVGLILLWNLVLRYEPVANLSSGVFLWWCALCAISILNVCGWRLSAAALARRKATAHPAIYSFQRRQLLLSAVYVLGCAFRSVLPRADVQRIGLLDSWASSVLVGRSVATVAELCFMAQWALLLHRAAKEGEARLLLVVSWLLVPLILVAEMCSWYSVVTTSYIGNTIEESLWALSALLLIISFIPLWFRSAPAYRPYLATALVFAVAYVTFMFTVDIPMYANRWLADEAAGRQYLSLSHGLSDVGSRWIVTFSWEDWRTEIPWMSLYFSVGVWCSLALVHAPVLNEGRWLRHQT
jgi:hypothetical protein